MARNRSLSGRIEDSAGEVDAKVTGGKSILDFGDTKPKFFKEKEGWNTFNIIPYEITSKNHPRVKMGKARVGDLDYMLDVWVHRRVGPAKTDVICPKKNFGHECPICNQAGEFWEAGKEKEAKDTWPKRRVFYNVEDTENAKGEIQIFHASFSLFQDEILKQSENRDGSHIPFADPDVGKLISFKAAAEELGKSKFFKYPKFEFEDRKAIKDEMIDKAFDFGKYLKYYTTEEIEAIMFGAEEEVEEDTPPPRQESRSRAVVDEKAESLVDDDDEPPARSRRGRDEEKEEKSENPCPAGLRFGKDLDKDEACDDCPKATYKACLQAKQGK